MVSFKDTTKSIDLLGAFKTTMDRFSLPMKNLLAIIINGAIAIVGKKWETR